MQESVTDPDTDISEILTERLALGLTVCALGLSLWGLIQREPYQAVLAALALAPDRCDGSCGHSSARRSHTRGDAGRAL